MNFMLAFLMHIEHLHLTLIQDTLIQGKIQNIHIKLPHSVTMIYFYNSMNLILIVTPCVSKNIIDIINLQYVQALYNNISFSGM